MAKKSYQVMQLKNSEVETHTKYIIHVPTRGQKAGQKTAGLSPHAGRSIVGIPA